MGQILAISATMLKILSKEKEVVGSRLFFFLIDEFVVLVVKEGIQGSFDIFCGLSF